MQFYANPIEITNLLPYTNHILKRNIRIKTSKLPHDFFIHTENCKHQVVPVTYRNRRYELLNRDLQTPCFSSRKISRLESKEKDNCERHAQTANPSLQKIQRSEPLSQNIAPPTKRPKRQLRNPSKQSKNDYSMDLDSRQFRLPKLMNKGISNYN